ncbi:Bifunctional protein GlmU [bacterium HR17]|uniref:Bifunctional protein GlmU n=1 Tax=Candidatus Fervidibacter japonicus TaxID=2035412 RepID=A0A2H5X9F8_9BACT|nr:Bifunctional protein GlmU [bacterium HR17]
MDERLTPQHYFDLSEFAHRDLFAGVQRVWEVIPRIGDYVRAIVTPDIRGTVMDGAFVSGQVFVGEGTVVEPGACIFGPAYIGKNCTVRSGAYVRGDVVTGDGVVLGHASEFKNCVLMDGAQCPHFNYVGDSILGRRSHLGAGVIVSNLKISRDEIVVRLGDTEYPTGLQKFGVILGDESEIGCNAVINPGTLVGRGCLAYPLTSLRGYYPPRSVIKLRQHLEAVQRR